MKKTLISISFILTVLCLANSLVFAEGSFSVGAMTGGFSPLAEEAMKNYQDTEWKANGIMAVSVLYRMPSDFALELFGESMKMRLQENGLNLGTLKMTPITLLFKMQGKPSSGKGFTYHADIGGGIIKSTFEKGSAIIDIEELYSDYGVKINLDTDNEFVFELGAGADYFFTKNIALVLDIKLLLANIGTSWSVSNPYASSSIPDMGDFMVSNLQYLVGLRFWF